MKNKKEILSDMKPNVSDHHIIDTNYSSSSEVSDEIVAEQARLFSLLTNPIAGGGLCRAHYDYASGGHYRLNSSEAKSLISNHALLIKRINDDREEIKTLREAVADAELLEPESRLDRDYWKKRALDAETRLSSLRRDLKEKWFEERMKYQQTAMRAEINNDQLKIGLKKAEESMDRQTAQFKLFSEVLLAIYPDVDIYYVRNIIRELLIKPQPSKSDHEIKPAWNNGDILWVVTCPPGNQRSFETKEKAREFMYEQADRYCDRFFADKEANVYKGMYYVTLRHPGREQKWEMHCISGGEKIGHMPWTVRILGGSASVVLETTEYTFETEDEAREFMYKHVDQLYDTLPNTKSKQVLRAPDRVHTLYGNDYIQWRLEYNSSTDN